MGKKENNMNWIENLLIIAGASLDIFAAMECQGSLVKKVNKKQLSVICIVVALLQLFALYVGYFLTSYLCKVNPVSNEALLGEILATVIFFFLGLRLLIKAIKNELIDEHLETKFAMKKFLHLSGTTSLYTIMTGIAFGFVGTNLSIALIMIVAVSVIFIILGVYTGYHFGFEQKTKAYIVGAVFLWLAGADIIVRQIMHIF